MAALMFKLTFVLFVGQVLCDTIPIGGPYIPEELVPFCSSTMEPNNTLITNCTTVSYDPNTALIPCIAVPAEFVSCTFEDLSNLSQDEYSALSSDQQQQGCRNYGNTLSSPAPYVVATCVVVPEIECAGNHTFFVENTYQCIRYNGIHFPTVVLMSIFLGWVGADRFCLGYTCMGVAKLLTVGGVGIWWVVDLALLTAGTTIPAYGYSWNPAF